MILSTWNFEYALQLQNTKTVCFRYGMFLLCETSNAFIDALCYSKILFHHSGPFKLIKTMLKSLHILKVYRQYGIVIQRVVTRKGLPSVQ